MQYALPLSSAHVTHSSVQYNALISTRCYQAVVDTGFVATLRGYVIPTCVYDIAEQKLASETRHCLEYGAGRALHQNPTSYTVFFLDVRIFRFVKILFVYFLLPD